MNQFNFEQFQAAIRDLAIISKEFFDKLVAQGFSASEALHLTGKFVESTIKK